MEVLSLPWHKDLFWPNTTMFQVLLVSGYFSEIWNIFYLTHTRCPKKNSALACCYSRANALFFWGHLVREHHFFCNRPYFLLCNIHLIYKRLCSASSRWSPPKKTASRILVNKFLLLLKIKNWNKKCFRTYKLYRPSS